MTKAKAPKTETKKSKITTTITSAITTASLRKWNLGLAGLHFIQGVAILLLGTTRDFPVNTSYLTADPISSEVNGSPILATAMHHLFDLNLAYVVAAFFFISAITHLIVATVYRKRYETGLTKGINCARWLEYALSASTMLVGIAVLSGIADLSTLVMIFMLDVVMNLLGLAMERYNQGTVKPNWLVYIIGCIAGIVPWIVFVIYMLGANMYGSGGVPTFVYWIYASMFLLFSSFAINMYLQYKKVGKWSNYLYGEQVYMILSLVAKTVLAWQVFAGALRP